MYQYAVPKHRQNLKSSSEMKIQKSQKYSNLTGIPDSMKHRYERISGLSFDDVRVHYHSAKPAQLKALAYTQGNQIYIGPGQERHLPHELGHVIQQMREHICGTRKIDGQSVNDNPAYEREADQLAKISLNPESNSEAKLKSSVFVPVKSVVQRRIGFEYETNADTYSVQNELTSAERRSAQIPAGSHWLNKGDRLIIFPNLFTAEADERIGGGSDLELVTATFDETPAGRQNLLTALIKIEQFCAMIDQKRARTPNIKNSYLSSAFGGVPQGLRYIHSAGAISGNPQATVGIRLDALSNFMSNAVGGINPNQPIDRYDLGYQNPGDYLLVGQSPALVTQGIQTYVQNNHPIGGFPQNFPSPELIGLCSLIRTYIVRGSNQAAVAYAKQIAPLMARTDLRRIFLDLPQAERNFLSANNGAHFIGIFTTILNHLNMNDHLFNLNPTDATQAGVLLNNHLTRIQWLRGISQNVDLLTRANFPLPAGRPYMESLGAFGQQQDAPPNPGQPQRPVFELRRMRKDRTPHEFTQVALGLFDYVLNLNANPQYNQGYAPVPQPQRGTTFMQRMRYFFSR